VSPILAPVLDGIQGSAASKSVAFNWAYGSINSVANSGVTTINVGTTNPAGSAGPVAATDKLIAVVVVSMTIGTDPGVITVTGFTMFSEVWNATFKTRTWLGYRDSSNGLVGGETVSYAASWTNASRGASWGIANYGNAATGSPVNTQQDNAAFSTNMTSPSINATTASDRLICTVSEFGGNPPYAGPAPMNTRFNVGTNSSDRPEIIIADQQLSATGATGTRTSTAGGSVQSQGNSLVLTPA